MLAASDALVALFNFCVSAFASDRRTAPCEICELIWIGESNRVKVAKLHSGTFAELCQLRLPTKRLQLATLKRHALQLPQTLAPERIIMKLYASPMPHKRFLAWALRNLIRTKKRRLLILRCDSFMPVIVLEVALLLQQYRRYYNITVTARASRLGATLPCLPFFC